MRLLPLPPPCADAPREGRATQGPAFPVVDGTARKDRETHLAKPTEQGRMGNKSQNRGFLMHDAIYTDADSRLMPL